MPRGRSLRRKHPALLLAVMPSLECLFQAPDGHRLCVSGGNTDRIFLYAWKDGAATFEHVFELAKEKTADETGTSYPAGLVFSPNRKFLYVAEDVGDRLAVVNAATGEITQRLPLL